MTCFGDLKEVGLYVRFEKNNFKRLTLPNWKDVNFKLLAIIFWP
jgi:hypothetical protein